MRIVLEFAMYPGLLEKDVSKIVTSLSSSYVWRSQCQQIVKREKNTSTEDN